MRIVIAPGICRHVLRFMGLLARLSALRIQRAGARLCFAYAALVLVRVYASHTPRCAPRNVFALCLRLERGGLK